MHALLTRHLDAARARLLAQFLRFGTVGAMGFVVDTATVYGLRGWLGLYGAGAFAYVVAASFTWAVNRAWTFRSAPRAAMGRQWALFLAVNGVGFLVNRGTFMLLVAAVPLCAEHPVLAILAGVFAGMFLNFAAARGIVFAPPKAAD